MAVEAFFRMADYEPFNLEMDRRVHVLISKIVRGDLFVYSGPYDPVFYLHHAQLDRIWWMWQQADLPYRLTDYAGRLLRNSTQRASLNDIIPMGGLAPDITIADMMETESGLLCYRY
ncbi:hypothetical protein MMC12_006312 [Toensbergia leucococca]|nr:hypothetical protein [Toensbergia leucococca]